MAIQQQLQINQLYQADNGNDWTKKIKKTDTKASKFAVFERDPVDELSDARKMFVKNTGGKLRDVKTAGAYKKLSAADKKRYRKLNPDDFPVDEDMSVKKNFIRSIIWADQ